MKIVRTIDEVRKAVTGARAEGREISFVPTMGYLHQGHLALVESAVSRGGYVVVSIFVNPKQFGSEDDLEKYPRDVERDRNLLEERSTDLLFVPDEAEMYPPGFATRVIVSGVAEPLEGKWRPGHFEGVATVVARLLNIVQPDVAIFGQKDAQQCAVVRRLVRDLAFPVTIVVEETVREPDGLAMSSRNVRLEAEDRERSTGLYAALEEGRKTWAERRNVEDAEMVMRRVAEDHGLEVEYLTVVDDQTFTKPSENGSAVLGVGAVRLGPVRLIDNLRFEGRDAG